MSKSLDEILAVRPVDRARVDALKKRMLDVIRAYRLRESRESSAITQVEFGDERIQIE